MFKVGESWVAPGNVFSVHVDSTNTDGFVVSIAYPVDLIFRSGFE